MYFTWDGMQLFSSAKTAGKHAELHSRDIKQLRVLSNGKLRLAERHEMLDVAAWARHFAVDNFDRFTLV